MVAETAVEEFKACVKSYKLSDEKMSQQQAILENIVAIKSEEGDNEQSVRLVKLFDTLTESLLKLTISVTDVSRDKLLKCEEEVASANSFIVKEGMGASRLPIGKGSFIQSCRNREVQGIELQRVETHTDDKLILYG